MKFAALLVLALFMSCLCDGQTSVKTVSLHELQSVIGLPLNQAVAAREAYKKPLKAALARQAGQAGTACQTASGQQPYNVCMGQEDETAGSDFAIFYNNLQMLCHDEDQLLTLQQSEKQWKAYSDSTMKATRATWPDGTAAPGVAGQVYLALIRDYMRLLDKIFDLNISQ